jgi:hypothetical protein
VRLRPSFLETGGGSGAGLEKGPAWSLTTRPHCAFAGSLAEDPATLAPPTSSFGTPAALRPPATHSIARGRPLPGCTMAAPACPMTVCRPWPARTRSWRWGRVWGCGLGRRRTTRSQQQRGMQPVLNSGPPDRGKIDLESRRKRATLKFISCHSLQNKPLKTAASSHTSGTGELRREDSYLGGMHGGTFS